MNQLFIWTSIFTTIIAGELPEVGVWELKNEMNLSENITKVAYSEPTIENSGKPLIKVEFYRSDEKNHTKKIFNYISQKYLFKMNYLTENSRRTRSLSEGANIFQHLKTDTRIMFKEIIFEDGPFHRMIFDLNGNEVAFYKSLPKKFIYFGTAVVDGRIMGINRNSRSLQVVSPHSNDPIDIISNINNISIEHGGNTYFNFNTNDIIFKVRIIATEGQHWGLVGAIDKNNKLLWERRVILNSDGETPPNIGFSNSGKYFILINRKYGTMSSDVEVIDRQGNTINYHYNIECSIGNIFYKISDDDKYFITSSKNHKEMIIYDLLSGKIINNLIFSGGHPIQWIEYCNATKHIYVLFAFPRGREGGRYIGVYALDGNVKNPLAQIKVGDFGAHDVYLKFLSVSGDGKEVSVRNGNKIKTYQLTINK